jgi:hypothetical protein
LDDPRNSAHARPQRVRDKLGGLESEMTKFQVAKSQSNPNDQAPKPKEELAFS